MYSDQCGRQSRNIKMATSCNFIVANNTFCKWNQSQILNKWSFYLPCNQDFGLIEKEKKSQIHICTWRYTVVKSLSYNKYDQE